MRSHLWSVSLGDSNLKLSGVRRWSDSFGTTRNLRPSGGSQVASPMTSTIS